MFTNFVLKIIRYLYAVLRRFNKKNEKNSASWFRKCCYPLRKKY